MNYFVEIFFGNDHTERHELRDRTTRVGGAASRNIRPARGAPSSNRAANCFATECLELERLEHGCRVTLLPGALTRTLSHHGRNVQTALVAWGDDAFVGAIRLTFLQEARKNRFTVLMVALVLIGLIPLFSAFFGDKMKSSGVSAVQPPPLFADPAACPQSQATGLPQFAGELERRAWAKQERSPFFVAESIEAVKLLRAARACYLKSGDESAASRLTKLLKSWTDRLNEDYAAARLRLRLAMQHERWADALKAVTLLETLGAAQTEHEYTVWLGRLRRDLELQLTRQKKKR